jgi:lipoprotein NlpD
MAQQQFVGLKTALLWTVLAASVVLSGCGSRVGLNRAPVEERGVPSASAPGGSPSALPGAPGAPGALPGATTTATIKPLPGIENLGKPGYYAVRPGDTMIRIGLDTGQNWRDITRWNGLDNPNVIEVGQVLRVIPPGTASVSDTGARPVVAPAPVVATNLPAVGARPASAPLGTTGTAATPAPAPAPVAAAPLPPASSAGDDDVAWIWPSSGGLIAGFDEAKNKGLDLAGKLGDPVLAAGDGRVVYAGAGLRGYGNLVILKHNNTYLTAYAHNQTLLVKEDQTVRKGQKIAEMGQSDADRVKLHFEIRRQGKPVDPARYLPAR